MRRRCLSLRALHGVPPRLGRIRRAKPAVTDAGSTVAGSALRRPEQIVHIADVQADPNYARAEVAQCRRGCRPGASAFRCHAQGGCLIGVFAIYSPEVRPFTDKQIELVTNFADQAVIAIENTRLFNELRQRSAIEQSLEQQTATAEVLEVISSSPVELEPVFQTMLRTRCGICEARFGIMVLYDGDAFRMVALHDAPRHSRSGSERDPIVRPPGQCFTGVADTKHVVHIADMAAESPREPIAQFAGVRTALIVPMLKGDRIGRRRLVLTARRSGRSPTSKSSWSRTSPTRR